MRYYVTNYPTLVYVTVSVCMEKPFSMGLFLFEQCVLFSLRFIIFDPYECARIKEGIEDPGVSQFQSFFCEM